MSHLHFNDKVFITARFNGKVFNALAGQHTKKKSFKNNLSKIVSNIWGYPSFRLLGQWTWLLQHVNNRVFASSCLFLSRSSRIQDQTDKLTVTLAIHTAPGLKLLNNSVVPVCWLFFFFSFWFHSSLSRLLSCVIWLVSWLIFFSRVPVPSICLLVSVGQGSGSSQLSSIRFNTFLNALVYSAQHPENKLERLVRIRLQRGYGK